MKTKAHFVTSAILAVAIFALYRQWSAAIATFLIGVFIDLDHFCDFWMSRPRRPFSIKAFLDPNAYMHKNQNRAFVPLHGYEFAVVLWLGALATSWPPLLVGIASAMTLHLILDDIGNNLKTLSYFIIFRAAHKFRVFKDKT